MFRVDQIVFASDFVRHFRAFARRLRDFNEPLLITQKNGEYLVVMHAEFFAGLLSARERIVSEGLLNGTTADEKSDHLKSDFASDSSHIVARGL